MVTLLVVPNQVPFTSSSLHFLYNITLCHAIIPQILPSSILVSFSYMSHSRSLRLTTELFKIAHKNLSLLTGKQECCSFLEKKKLVYYAQACWKEGMPLLLIHNTATQYFHYYPLKYWEERLTSKLAAYHIPRTAGLLQVKEWLKSCKTLLYVVANFRKQDFSSADGNNAKLGGLGFSCLFCYRFSMISDKSLGDLRQGEPSVKCEYIDLPTSLVTL